MRGAFESAGDIRSVDLLAALVALWRSKADGSLEFSRPGATAGFGLRGGELVLSISSQPQFETAAILSRAGKLDAVALEKLKGPAGGDEAIAALQAGLISVRELRWGRKIRAIEILSDLLGWLEGEYSYDPESRPAPGDWTLSVPRLVLELFLRSRDRTLVEHYLGPSDLPLLRAAAFDAEFETFGLTADAGSVVALIDGRASAEEIAERAPAEEFAVLKLLAALTTLGLAHPAEAAPEPERPTESPTPPAAPEPVVEPGPGESVLSEPEEKLEPEKEEEKGKAKEEEKEEETPAPPVEEPAKEPEKKPAPPEREEEISPAKFEETAAGTPVSGPEPASDGAAPQPPVPEDILPESPVLSISLEPVDVIFEPRIPPAEAPPLGDEKRRMGVPLAGLLALLVVAVAALVIARSRGPSRARSLAATPLPTAQPTAQESLVFPPAETAVPLSARRTQAALPSPAVTRPAAMPTLAPTAVPRPTSPPTRVPTLPPTRPPTQPPTRVPTRAEPTKPPTRIPTRAAPSPVPTKSRPTRPPTRVPTKPEPTAPPPRARPTAVPTTVAAAGGEATRADWLARAERDRRTLSRHRNVRYAVQLELACELPTLAKAWDWDKPSGTLWLLTTSFRGRTCFRVLWGRFASLSEARDAKGRVPGFFVAPGNRPMVVSVR